MAELTRPASAHLGTGMNARKKDEIFNAAAEIDDSYERDSYLKRACGDDLSLRAEIDELLDP